MKQSFFVPINRNPDLPGRLPYSLALARDDPVKRLSAFALVLGLVCYGLIFPNQKIAYSVDSDPCFNSQKDNQRSWQIKNHENAIYQWVESFNDPLLVAVVREVLRNNYDIQKATVRLVRAQGLVAKAMAGLRPLLNLRGGAVYLAGVENNNLDRLAGSVSADISWDIDIWREGRFELDRQKADLSASESDLFFVQHYIVVQTVKSWILAIETKLQLEIAARLLENYGNIFEIIQSKYGQGFVQKQDISAVRAKLAQAQETYFQLQGAHIEVLRSIELLLGRNPEGKLVIAKELPDLSDLPKNLAISNISERRDDILAAWYRLDGASLNLERAKKSNYPRLKFTSSLIKSDPEFNILTNSSQAFSASGLRLDVPLLDGGRANADISISTAEKDIAALQYRQSHQEAANEIEIALMNERILEKRREYLELVLEENTQVQELAKKQYQAGEIDRLTVIYHLLQTDEAKAKSLHLKAVQLMQRADLYYSLGGRQK